MYSKQKGYILQVFLQQIGENFKMEKYIQLQIESIQEILNEEAGLSRVTFQLYVILTD